MKNHVEYMYAIFLTPSGKNYGCFAFDKSNLSNGEVRVGASFCDKDDRKHFSKKEAKKVAESRLSKDEAVYLLDSKEFMYEMGDVDNSDLLDLYLEKNLEFTLLSDLTDKYEVNKVVRCKSLSTDVPSWVAKAAMNRAISTTLKNDNMSLQDLAVHLDYENRTNVLYSLFVSLKNSTVNCWGKRLNYVVPSLSCDENGLDYPMPEYLCDDKS